MPQSTYTDVLGSNTEFIEELITQHKTKRGVHIKKTWTAGTKHPLTKEENASGSCSKTKKKAQASQAEKETEVLERDTFVEMCEPGDYFDYQPDDLPEESQPQANVCVTVTTTVRLT